MHPLLAERRGLSMYVGGWLVIAAGLVALVMRLEPRPPGDAVLLVAPLALVYAFICLSAWWVCRAIPLGRTSPERLAVFVLGASLQAGAAWTAIGAGWAWLLRARFGVPAGADDRWFLFAVGVVLYLVSIAFHYAWMALAGVRAAERRLLESRVAARDAELRALRAQLHPHFLFNSLNSISALTGPDPEAARRMCGLLGDFLRTSLALGSRESVPLSEELALADRYLAIETVRFGSRLCVTRSVEAAAERCLVPPLLIQPLIENAVKHGVARQSEGGAIAIEACRRGPSVQISVVNSRDAEAPANRGAGLGLENVRRRLAALDPEAARVDVSAGEADFRVTLTLPAVESNGSAT